jgi:hypothetical protein
LVVMALPSIAVIARLRMGSASTFATNEALEIDERRVPPDRGRCGLV